MLIRNFSSYFAKNRFHHRRFPSDLKKSLLTLKRSIYSRVGFQYSYVWYIEHIELVKLLNFPKVSNTPREIYEEFFLEACRF